MPSERRPGEASPTRSPHQQGDFFRARPKKSLSCQICGGFMFGIRADQGTMWLDHRKEANRGAKTHSQLRRGTFAEGQILAVWPKGKISESGRRANASNLASGQLIESNCPEADPKRVRIAPPISVDTFTTDRPHQSRFSLRPQCPLPPGRSDFGAPAAAKLPLHGRNSSALSTHITKNGRAASRFLR